MVRMYTWLPCYPMGCVLSGHFVFALGPLVISLAGLGAFGTPPFHLCTEWSQIALE